MAISSEGFFFLFLFPSQQPLDRCADMLNYQTSPNKYYIQDCKTLSCPLYHGINIYKNRTSSATEALLSVDALGSIPSCCRGVGSCHGIALWKVCMEKFHISKCEKMMFEKLICHERSVSVWVWRGSTAEGRSPESGLHPQSRKKPHSLMQTLREVQRFLKTRTREHSSPWAKLLMKYTSPLKNKSCHAWLNTSLLPGRGHEGCPAPQPAWRRSGSDCRFTSPPPSSLCKGSDKGASPRRGVGWVRGSILVWHGETAQGREDTNFDTFGHMHLTIPLLGPQWTVEVL